MDKVELLSPAGDYECFKSAVSAGCDAVYLSGEKYGARAYAKNFTFDEVIKAIETAHLYGKKVYLTVNTLLKDDELSGLYDYLYPFYEAGLDSVIVQDIGVISYIRRHFPMLNVHASTQLAITSAEGIRLLSGLGVKRTVLARELSLAEIKEIHKQDEMELECFIHGALCYSYSGKCLFSSLVGGRSGNRGRCAGSCRQPYNDKYVLSTKDICCLEILPELISAGITSFKIEGRMKSPEYVYGVTSIYRKYIDLFYDNLPEDVLNMDASDTQRNLNILNEPINVDVIRQKVFTGKSFNNDLATLERLYTRGGNSQGYYFKHNGRDMISLEDASYKRDSEASDNVQIPPLDKLKITGNISVITGEYLILKLKYNNTEVTVYGEEVDKAANTPIDENTVRKQLTKTGDTVFDFEKIEFDISSDAFVRVSALNKLRRDGLDALKDKILEWTRRNDNACNNDACNDNASADVTLADSYKPINKLNKNANDNNCTGSNMMLSADICTEEQLEICLNNNSIDRLYVPYNLFKKNVNIKKSTTGKNKDKEVYIKFQSVIRNGFLQKNSLEILENLQYADGALIDNNELLYFLKKNGFSKPIVADIHMYYLNDEACNAYRELGISRFTVPVELNKHELYARNSTNEELIVYGYLPMMISAQCVNNTLNGCDKSTKRIRLKDRKGAAFTCVNDCDNCTNTIYNSVPISLHDEWGLIDALKPESLRICLTIEDATRTKDIVDFFSDFCSTKAQPPYKYFTKGHINRGVL